MPFTTITLFKAIFAGVVAFSGAVGAVASAHGGDVGALDIGSWMLAIGSGLTAAGALLHTPDKTAPADKAINTVQDVVVATTQAQQDLTKQAVDSINAVLGAVGKVVPLPTISGVPSLPTQIQPDWPTVGTSGLSTVPIIGQAFGAGEAILGPLAGQIVQQVVGKL